ncbi:MAG TPA: MgtC/SapB family protein [Burkholderiales bacterium]|nr:MgtC/SapB family protein [Burkholderiales bacterium]
MDWASQLPIIGEVALAMVLGGAIGVEREFADKPAGFRTHMLVAGAAALLVGLSAALVAEYAAHPNSDLLRFDPVRVVEAIVTGVSFLGAGTIFRRSETNHVEGLTTAASILLAAAVGISVALRQFALAVAVTVLVLLVCAECGSSRNG